MDRNELRKRYDTWKFHGVRDAARDTKIGEHNGFPTRVIVNTKTGAVYSVVRDRIRMPAWKEKDQIYFWTEIHMTTAQIKLEFANMLESEICGNGSDAMWVVRRDGTRHWYLTSEAE